MARIVKTIEIEGQKVVALFDTGALYTYIRSNLAIGVPRIEVPTPPLLRWVERSLKSAKSASSKEK